MTSPTSSNRFWAGLTVLAAVVAFGIGYEAVEPIIDTAVANNFQLGAVRNGNWSTRLDLARSDTPPVVRAGVARIGLGANQAEEAVYWTTYTDSDGATLRGDVSYRITIARKVPVLGFWSLTAYGGDHFLMPNAERRYAVTDRSIVPDATGRYAFYLAPTQPAAVSEPAYWIPTHGKPEPVVLIFRAYHPDAEMLLTPTSVAMPQIHRIAP